VTCVTLAAALLAAAALGGCATCDPERNKVEPRVGGEIGTGTGGSWSAMGIGFDVTNLFCRAPKDEPTDVETTAETPPAAPPPLEDAEPSTAP
jgi:hypothetical protein